MEIIDFDTIDSTSSYLKENESKYDSFTFVTALEQTSGRGRENRKWLSRKGENFLFSFLLKEDGLEKVFPSISLGCAASIFNSLKSLEIKGLSIKWPNDVYIGDKKVVGILLEGKLPEYLVAGIGINVNQTKFEGEYRTTPTSLALELGKEIDLDALKNLIFANLEQDIKTILKGDNSFLDTVRNNDYLLNKERRFVLNGNEVSGKVIGINDDCSLKVVYEGNILSLDSGEIN